LNFFYEFYILIIKEYKRFLHNYLYAKSFIRLMMRISLSSISTKGTAIEPRESISAVTISYINEDEAQIMVE